MEGASSARAAKVEKAIKLVHRVFFIMPFHFVEHVFPQGTAGDQVCNSDRLYTQHNQDSTAVKEKVYEMDDCILSGSGKAKIRLSREPDLCPTTAVSYTSVYRRILK